MLMAAIGAALLATTIPASAKTICYVTAADSHPYVTPANKALNARAAELGHEVLSLSQNFDAQIGTEQMNTCIARRVAGIILWPLDPQAYIPALARAKQANIPILLINSPMDKAADQFVASFTGPDVYEQGKIAADALNAALDGQGSVIVLAGQAGNGTTIGRVAGFNDRLAEIGSKVKVLDTVNADFDQQKALVASRDLITRFGDQITGVYANDDIMARGFLDAWKEARSGQKMPVVVGIGGMVAAFAAIKSGEMAATILQSPTLDGKLAMDTMNDILAGKQVPTRVPLQLTTVTKDNVAKLEPAF